MTDNNHGSCVLCQNKSACFKQLENLELEFAAANKTQIHFRKGEIIAKQGSFVTHILFLKTGLAKIYREVDRENDMIFNFFPAGNLIGLPSLYSDSTLNFSVAAVEDSSVCAIDIKVFQKLILQNGAFASEVVNTINRCQNYSYDRIYSLTQKQSNGRMADAILYLADTVYQSDEFKLSLSRKDLAEFTGLSVMSVVRTIKEFKADGIISNTNTQLKILNRPQLEKISKHG